MMRSNLLCISLCLSLVISVFCLQDLCKLKLQGVVGSPDFWRVMFCVKNGIKHSTMGDDAQLHKIQERMFAHLAHDIHNPSEWMEDKTSPEYILASDNQVLATWLFDVFRTAGVGNDKISHLEWPQFASQFLDHKYGSDMYVFKITLPELKAGKTVHLPAQSFVVTKTFDSHDVYQVYYSATGHYTLKQWLANLSGLYPMSAKLNTIKFKTFLETIDSYLKGLRGSDGIVTEMVRSDYEILWGVNFPFRLGSKVTTNNLAQPKVSVAFFDAESCVKHVAEDNFFYIQRSSKEAFFDVRL